MAEGKRKKIPAEWFNNMDYGPRSGLQDTAPFSVFMCALASLQRLAGWAPRCWFSISHGEATCQACSGFGAASGVCEYVDELEFWLSAHAGVHADAVGHDRALAFETFVGMRFPGGRSARMPAGALAECWKEFFGEQLDAAK